MTGKITFLVKIIVITLFLCISLYAENTKIVPLKKPILSEDIIKKKISKNIIKPKKKPSLKTESKDQKEDKEAVKEE